MEMMDRYVGGVSATLRSFGPPRLDVRPGPARFSNKLLAMAGEFLTVEGDVITITGVDADGAELVVRYRIIGEESEGPESGWKLTEPIQN